MSRFWKVVPKEPILLEADNYIEADQKLAHLVLEGLFQVVEEPNIGIWQILLIDGSLYSSAPFTFMDKHGVKRGTIHKFAMDYGCARGTEKVYYKGKVIEVKQEKNKFYFICKDITRKKK